MPRGSSLGNNELAQAIGVSPSTISRFAHGSEIDQTNLLKLIGYYDEDLEKEVRLLLDYVRVSLSRRFRNSPIA